MKRDARGRVRTPPEQREAILAEYARSGLSGATFAREHGIKYPTFAAWVAARRRAAPGAGPPARFAEVMLCEAAGGESQPSGAWGNGAGMAIELPGGGRIRVRDAGEAHLAAAVLKAMQQPVAQGEQPGC